MISIELETGQSEQKEWELHFGNIYAGSGVVIGREEKESVPNRIKEDKN